MNELVRELELWVDETTLCGWRFFPLSTRGED